MTTATQTTSSKPLFKVVGQPNSESADRVLELGQPCKTVRQFLEMPYFESDTRLKNHTKNQHEAKEGV